MAVVYPTYPVTTLAQAEDMIIFTSNQIHDIMNADATSVIEAEDGQIPSIRKALVDNMYFKSPVNWQQGNITTNFNQLYLYADGCYYYSPFATLTTPVTQGETPVNDTNWKLHSGGSAIQWSYTATGGETTITPPYLFNTAAISIDGRVQTPIKSYSINNNTIILTEQLYLGETVVVTLTPTKIMQHALQQSTTGSIKFLEVQVTTPTNVFSLSEPITEALVFINGVCSSLLIHPINKD